MGAVPGAERVRGGEPHPVGERPVRAQAADALLRETGIGGVEIEPAQGFLSDHYVPGQKRLRLSPEVYSGRSLAAVGVAAHECGHALQDARHYPLLGLRNFLVPVASIGSNVAWIIMIAGFVLSLTPLVLVGIIAFSTTVVFQLVNLPVEFDASRRARRRYWRRGWCLIRRTRRSRRCWTRRR